MTTANDECFTMHIYSHDIASLLKKSCESSLNPKHRKGAKEYVIQ